MMRLPNDKVLSALILPIIGWLPMVLLDTANADIRFTFDQGHGPGYTYDAATTTITSNVNEVISGKSLKINTSSSANEWNWGFTTSKAMVPLLPGKRYSISFHYKILQLISSDAYLMVYAYSVSQAAGHRGWTNIRDQYGDNFQTINIIIPEGVSDYQIAFGVHRKGVVVIDNILIRQLPDIDLDGEGIAVDESDYQPYGMCTHFDRGPEWVGSGFTDAQVITCLDLLQEAGIQWIRVNASWCYLEWTRGQINGTMLSRIDLIVNEALSRGIQPYLQIGVSPQWASESPDAADWWAYAPADLDAWALHVTFLANRYKARIKYWEVHNEVDWIFWQSSPAQYVEFLRVAHQALKQVDPDNQVILGGLAFDGVHVYQLIPGATEYALQKMYDAGLKYYFDIMALHPYSHDPVYGTVVSADIINSVYEIMKRNYDGQKPIWLTELGIAAKGTDPVQLQNQAAYVENIFTELIRHPKVDKIFYYVFNCMQGQGEDLDNFGILNYDFTPRPAYFALKMLSKAASRIVNPTLLTENLRWDSNGDNRIDLADLVNMMQVWLKDDCRSSSGCDSADLDYSGRVDMADLANFANRWLETYP